MVYKKTTFIALCFAIIAAVVSNFVFATASVAVNDKIFDSTMQVLIFIQKYSWPVITLIFIYALYQFYVVGSEFLEHKVLGQKMIVGIAIFMAIVQTLPLIYAFLLLK